MRILDQMRKDGVTLAESYALSIENAMVTDSGISRIVGKARSSAGMKYLRILGQKGRFLTRADLLAEEQVPPMDILSQFDVEPDDDLMKKVVATKQPADVIEQSPSGETILRVMVPLYFFGSMVGAVEVGMDLAPMRSAVRQAAIRSVALTVAAIVVGSLGIFWLALKITRPLSTLTVAAGRVASGDLSPRIEVRTGDEIGDLAAAFNVMASNLEKSMSSLKGAYRELERHTRTICELKEYTESILDTIAAGVITVDANGNVTTANRAAAEMLGLPAGAPVVSEPFRRVLRDQPSLCSIVHDSVVSKNALYGLEVSETWPRPATFLVNTAVMTEPDGAFAGVAITFQDLTQQKELQAKATRQDRLTELGRLAAAIAHEVRNPIGSIRSCARYLHSKVQEGEAASLLDIVVKEADRLNVLVQQLLDFAQPVSTAPRFADVGNVLSDTINLIRPRALADGVDVVLRIEASPGCFIDEDRIRQAFLNVCVNALEAMSEEGTLTVTYGYDSSSGSLLVAFDDTGPGIDPEVLPHVFEPFYTTRKRGTGLGLAIVKQIVEEHGGAVSVTSPYPPISRHGTRFEISLPVPYESCMSSSCPATEGETPSACADSHSGR